MSGPGASPDFAGPDPFPAQRETGRLARKEFDLRAPAPNGLRRGRTTGTCATAAVKAALSLLLRGEHCTHVEVSLPDGVHYLVVPILNVRRTDAHTVRAEVRKDGGDDPDATHAATIFAEVRANEVNEIRFFAGQGVGTATQPGLRVPVGEPAINPVARAMMRQAVGEMTETSGSRGFDLTIGCENGEAIARKTFNPRLGVVGGISILGTSGIVEPMSLASMIASIEVYVRVALGDDAHAVAFLPGKIGLPYARNTLNLPERKAVQIGNFLGDALTFLQQALGEKQRRLPTLWLLGHPGKLAKVLDDAWDTHSSRSGMAMASVARTAAACGWKPELVKAIMLANTVEAVADQMRGDPRAKALWTQVERDIADRVRCRVRSVDHVEVCLFDLQGHALGVAA